MHSAKHYNVAPRYTPGSPALVPERIAMRVAEEEKRAIKDVLDGFEGPQRQKRAQNLGLRGIVEARICRGSGKKLGWEVVDLCTGEHFFRLASEALAKLGWRKYRELKTWEQKLVDQEPPLDIQDPHRAWYRLAPKMTDDMPGWKATVYRPEALESSAGLQGAHR